MGRTPPRARRRSRPVLAAGALLASASLVLPATSAVGKRPDGVPGHGNGNGSANGHGKGPKHADAPQVATAAPAPTAATPVTTSTKQHGNGNGKAKGQKKNAAPATSAATPTPTSTSTPTPAAAAPTPTTAAPPLASPRARSGRRESAKRRARTVARRATARGTAAAAVAAARPVRAPTPSAPAAPKSTHQPAKPRAHHKAEDPPAVVRTLRRVVERIPTFVKALIVILGALLLVTSLAWALLARTARYLRRQRAHLLGEIGVLQGALLPNVPAELSRLEASVAYRPAEGLAAGGGFYDAFPLDDGRVGIVVGDVAGHGKEALMHTSLLRYTLRAYLEADLEPRVALQLVGRALDRGFDTLATVVLAVYDPGRHVLRYASAGHPPPVFLGEADHVPVTQASAPPIGAGVPTGVRQTTVSLPSGSAVCFFTDGLIEARRGDAMIGRLGLVEIIRELGPDATAQRLLARIAPRAAVVSDDMAACMFRVSDGPNEAYLPRVEEIELSRDEPIEPTLGRFLEACGLDEGAVEDVTERTKRAVRQFRGAVVRVSLPRGGPRVEVRPANV